MKKLASVLTIIVMLFSITACSSKNETSQLSKVLGVDLSSGIISKSEDSHGGFHNDGKTFIEITFSDNNETLEEEIKTNSNWTEMPFSENLHTLVYGKTSDTESVGPCVADDDNKPLFPNIENGYYFFKDRHSESKNASDDTDVLNRNSFNFTIAIYDSTTRAIYYYELDT